MVRICPERFSPETLKKLHACGSGPFKILRKINTNAHVQDLSDHLTFNIENLVAYKGPDFRLENSLVNESDPEPTFERSLLPPLPNIPPTTDEINNILDDEIISTRDGGIQRYLVCWKGRPNFDDI